MRIDKAAASGASEPARSRAGILSKELNLTRLPFLPVRLASKAEYTDGSIAIGSTAMRSRLYVTLGLHWTIAYVLEQSPHRIRPDITLCELGADSFDMVELQALVEEALAL